MNKVIFIIKKFFTKCFSIIYCSQSNKELKHAKLSASGSSRWLNCPGSIKAEERYPDTISQAAIDGTAAHAVVENCLKNETDAISFLNKDIEGITVDDEMVLNCQKYLDYVRSFDRAGCVMFIEKKVSFSNYADGGFGTCDCCIIDIVEKTCHIFDYKNGVNRVEIEDNKQLQLYALGFLNEIIEKKLQIKKFKLHIIQPRIYNTNSWEVSVDDLLKFGEEVKVKSKLALSDNPPRVAGHTQCQWCKAKASCRIFAEFATNDIMEGFEVVDYNKLSDDEKGKILESKKVINLLLKSIEEDFFNRISSGKNIEGYVIENKKSRRVWADNAENYLYNSLGDKAFQKKLISITNAEKLLNKDELNEYTVLEKGELALKKVK